MQAWYRRARLSALHSSVSLIAASFFRVGRTPKSLHANDLLATSRSLFALTRYGFDRNALLDETSIDVDDQGQRCTIRPYTCLSRLERKAGIRGSNGPLPILNIDLEPQVLMACDSAVLEQH